MEAPEYIKETDIDCVQGSVGSGRDRGGSEDEYESGEEQPGEEEAGIMYPRRAIVTPLRALLYLGAPEVSNRIIRRLALQTAPSNLVPHPLQSNVMQCCAAGCTCAAPPIC